MEFAFLARTTSAPPALLLGHAQIIHALFADMYSSLLNRDQILDIEEWQICPRGIVSDGHFVVGSIYRIEEVPLQGSLLQGCGLHAGFKVIKAIPLNASDQLPSMSYPTSWVYLNPLKISHL